MQRAFAWWPLLLLAGGCSGLLPSEYSRTQGIWDSYPQAQRTFEDIHPYQTTLKELSTQGIDPAASPNIRLLNYADVAQRFLPDTPAVTLNDLDIGIQDCLRAKTACTGLQLHQDFKNTDHNGNFFLEFFGFKRKTDTHGWSFDGLLLVKDGIVIYKLAGGQPAINEQSEKTNWLGPLQGIGKRLLSFF
jgi:hypothetical protein